MAYFVVEYRENSRRKWRTVDECITKEEAATNTEKYSVHIRREEERDGMAYRFRKVKGTLKGKENGENK